MSSLIKPTDVFDDFYRPFGSLFTQGFPSRVFADHDAWLPAADVRRDGDGYVIEMEVPGFKPEDIDVDMSGSELVYILTNDDVLPLTVELRNRGGHDADDYFAYVSFGNAMQVQNAPGSCSPTTNPPPMPEWQLPGAFCTCIASPNET